MKLSAIFVLSLLTTSIAFAEYDEMINIEGKIDAAIESAEERAQERMEGETNHMVLTEGKIGAAIENLEEKESDDLALMINTEGKIQAAMEDAKSSKGTKKEIKEKRENNNTDKAVMREPNLVRDLAEMTFKDVYKELDEETLLRLVSELENTLSFEKTETENLESCMDESIKSIGTFCLRNIVMERADALNLYDLVSRGVPEEVQEIHSLEGEEFRNSEDRVDNSFRGK
jgi:hypothetical protein